MHGVTWWPMQPAGTTRVHPVVDILQHTEQLTMSAAESWTRCAGDLQCQILI